MKGILKALAPTLVNVATTANPLAGMAVKMAASRLGLPDTVSIDEVERHVEAHPEKAELLRNTETELMRMQTNLAGFEAQTADKQDARRVFATDWTPKIFAIVSLLGFLGYIFMVTITPDHDAGIVNLVIGYLGGLVSGITSFFFGSSHKAE